MTDLNERIATLEVLVEQLTARVISHMEREEEERKELLKLISELQQVQLKQKGFIGGMVFAVSALWAAGLAVWEIFKK